MNIFNRDPQLLVLFHVLYEELNASRAAERLSISQPGLTHKLNKLRDEWQDPLFIKAPRGLTPTPKALQLAPLVAKLVHELDGFYQTLETEDFLNRHEKITVYTTDYMEQKLFPALFQTVLQQTPNLRLITQNTQGKLPREALEKGLCDLAIAGFYADLPDTFRQQFLFEESFVVLMNRNYAERLQDSANITLDNYLAAKHLVITLNGDLHSNVDKKLHTLGLKRQVVAGIASFLSSAAIIKENDMILTCLQSVAECFTKNDKNLCYQPLPFDMPNVKMMQIWHERTHHDPLRVWLRQQIKHLLIDTNQ